MSMHCFFPYKCDDFLTWDHWCLYGSELPNRDGRYFVPVTLSPIPPYW